MNSNQQAQIITEYLKCALFHFSLYPVFVFLVSLGNAITPISEPTLLWYLLIGISLPFFYHLRDRCRRFFSLFLSHLLIGILFLVLPIYPHLSERVITGFFLLIYGIYSLNTRVKTGQAEDKTMPKAIVYGLSIGVLFLLRIQRNDLQLNRLLLNLVICTLIALVNDFLEAYCRFLYVNESSTGYIPAETILRRGIRPVLLFVSGLGLVMAAVCNIGWLTTLWDRLTQLLKRFTRWFFGHFHPAETVPEEYYPEQIAPAGGGLPDFLAEDAEPAMIWVILQNIMMVVVPVVLIVLILYGLVRLMIYLRERMRDRMQMVLPDADETEEDIRERIDVEGSHSFFSRKIFSKESNNDKVRRAFRKHVNDRKRFFSIGNFQLKALTAREMRELLESEYETGSCYTVYEKARYSDREVTNDDVILVRDQFRKSR